MRCNVLVDIVDPDDTLNTAMVTGAGDPDGSSSTLGLPGLPSVLEIPTLGWQGLLVLLLGLGLAGSYLLWRR